MPTVRLVEQQPAGGAGPPEPRTVAELARELGITEREAVALCIATGAKVHDGSSSLRPGDAARVRDLLAGRRTLPDVKVRSPGSRKIAVEAVIAVGILAALVIGLVAVTSWLSGREAVIDIEAGDCFDVPAGVTLNTRVFDNDITKVSCSGPHSMRAFGVIDLEERFSTFPGEAEVIEVAQDRCPVLAEAAGVEQMFIYSYFPKTQEAWDGGKARTIVG